MDSLATMGGSKRKKNVKMHLESLSIEAADYGGFIVRCSYEGRKDSDHQYDSKTKVFTKVSKLTKFVESAMEELGAEMDDDEED